LLASSGGVKEKRVLNKEVLLAWSGEAARDDDPVMAELLLLLATLRGCSDHWSIEMLRRIAELRVHEAAAGVSTGELGWPELIDG
jgi:hypothetical protein